MDVSDVFRSEGTQEFIGSNFQQSILGWQGRFNLVVKDRFLSSQSCYPGFDVDFDLILMLIYLILMLIQFFDVDLIFNLTLGL